MKTTPMCGTHTPRSTGLSFAVRAFSAPNLTVQGTALSAATAVAAAEVAVAGVRSTDLPGSPSRGAPV